MAFQSKERIRQRWLWSVEDMVKKACPELAGRMDWDTAIYLFNTGVRNIEAAEKLVAFAQAASGIRCGQREASLTD